MLPLDLILELQFNILEFHYRVVVEENNIYVEQTFTTVLLDTCRSIAFLILCDTLNLIMNVKDTLECTPFLQH